MIRIYPLGFRVIFVLITIVPSFLIAWINIDPNQNVKLGMPSVAIAMGCGGACGLLFSIRERFDGNKYLPFAYALMGILAGINFAAIVREPWPYSAFCTPPLLAGVYFGYIFKSKETEGKSPYQTKA